MKKLFSLLVVTLCCCNVQSQSANDDPGKTLPGFFAGISYSYYSLETELNSLSYHSIWYDQDLGTVTFNDEELDQINEQTTEMNYMHQLAVEPGIILLNNNRWYFDGRLLLGISRIKYKTTIDQPDENRREVTSEFNDPVGGLSLNLRYNFSERWGLTFDPHFIYTWGKAEKIIDSIRPQVNFFINDLKEDYAMGYGRINLMASYLTKKVIISVGPGVNYIFLNKTYAINRTNPENGDKYHDQIESSFRTVAIFDACLRADWTIIDPLILSVEAAVGKNLFIKTGFRYNF